MAKIEKDTAQFDDLPAGVVNRIHKHDDLDSSSGAHHHTLGLRATQASPGNHTHDGFSSNLLLSGTTLSGSRASGAALLSVIAALVQLGATDSTTA